MRDSLGFVVLTERCDPATVPPSTVISGGEGSIHPKFVDFVRYAREVGYSRVQTVTNGYMFSKRDFYLKAVEAGLGEITFSLHGHTVSNVHSDAIAADYQIGSFFSH